MFAGWRLYGRNAAQIAEEVDPLQRLNGTVFRWLSNRLYVDELYAATVIRLNNIMSIVADLLDRLVWGGHGPSRSYATELGKIFDADLSDRDRMKILGGNLRRICAPIFRKKGIKIDV